MCYLGKVSVWRSWETETGSENSAEVHSWTREIWRYVHSWESLEDFPAGLVAMTPCSQCRGPRFDPWSGNQVPHAAIKSSYAVTKTQHNQINFYFLVFEKNSWRYLGKLRWSFKALGLQIMDGGLCTGRYGNKGKKKEWTLTKHLLCAMKCAGRLQNDHGENGDSLHQDLPWCRWHVWFIFSYLIVTAII